MRVPRIGSIYTPGVKKSSVASHYKKLTDPLSSDERKSQNTNFGERRPYAYYLKIYSTLPNSITSNLKPKDAADMFEYMEDVANGVKKPHVLGQSSNAKLYKNPWLAEQTTCYFLVLKDPADSLSASETIYTGPEVHLGDGVWSNFQDRRIQLVNTYA